MVGKALAKTPSKPLTSEHREIEGVKRRGSRYLSPVPALLSRSVLWIQADLLSVASSPSLPIAASQEAIRKSLVFLKNSMGTACVSGKEPGAGYQGSQEPTWTLLPIPG